MVLNLSFPSFFIFFFFRILTLELCHDLLYHGYYFGVLDRQVKSEIEKDKIALHG